MDWSSTDLKCLIAVKVSGNEDDDDEWDEELQREFELVSGDLSGLDEEDDLNNDLLEIEKTKLSGDIKSKPS